MGTVCSCGLDDVEDMFNGEGNGLVDGLICNHSKQTSKLLRSAGNLLMPWHRQAAKVNKRPPSHAWTNVWCETGPAQFIALNLKKPQY